VACDEAQALLSEAMALHSRDDIDRALAKAHAAIERAPEFGEAYAYLGNTLVTRRRQFADGLAAMEQAIALLPEDATVRYTLGWCREFVAHAIERGRGGSFQSISDDAPTLYSRARETFLHALALDPDPGLRGDIEDMLDVIASATGEPWESEHAPSAEASGGTV
jgi:tetratricopeptide (TPR) repeat protein